MKMFLIVLVGIFFATNFAQDVVDVRCSQNAIIARIQKDVVATANHQMSDVHLNDRNCVFNESDETFFIRRIDPLTSCGTNFKVNDTHVEFTNSISTIDTGLSYPYGVVVGSQANSNVLSAKISCVFPIDLNVSTMFIPNISIVMIHMPDAFGTGEFRAAMSLYTDATYRQRYNSPPIMDPEETLYIGVHLLEETSEDVYLRIEECWGTVYEDPSSSPKYPLIEDGCPVRTSANGLVRITQNGINHQGLWNSPVFKFVGEGSEFDNVWLHCNLQICINQQCQPQCSARRKRRSIDKNGRRTWGPNDFEMPYIVSLGPVSRMKITEIGENETKTTYIDIEQDLDYDFLDRRNMRLIGSKNDKETHEKVFEKTIWNKTTFAIIGVLGSMALIFMMLGLIVIIGRARNRQSKAGFDLGGSTNKAFS